MGDCSLTPPERKEWPLRWRLSQCGGDSRPGSVASAFPVKLRSERRACSSEGAARQGEGPPCRAALLSTAAARTAARRHKARLGCCSSHLGLSCF